MTTDAQTDQVLGLADVLQELLAVAGPERVTVVAYPLRGVEFPTL